MTAAALAEEPSKPSAEHEHARSNLARAMERAERQPAAPAEIVAGQYKVQTGQPLPALDTAFSKAYAVQDGKDAARPLYALITDGRMPVRGPMIKALLGTKVPNLLPLLAAGPVEIGAVRRYAMIHERPQGKTLAALMAERGKPFGESFIAERIAAPVGAALEQLAEQGLSHGRIHPGNIFLGETLMLGECVSEPCGYSQPYAFETPERAQADRAGKGEGSPAQDAYALGVLAAYLRLGPHLFNTSPTPEAHILRVLGNGSYGAYTHNVDFSDAMTDFLRGTLHDVPQERWTWEEITTWAKGRRFNMLPPTPPGAGSRPFYIGQEAFHTLRDLAQGLNMHWDAARKMLLDGTLIRWVDLNTGRKDMADMLRRTVASVVASGGRGLNQAQIDETISRCLMIMDPLSPITIGRLRVQPDGIGPALADAIRENAADRIQAAGDILSQGLSSVWMDLQKRKEDQLPHHLTVTLWQLDRARQVLRVPGMGFGLERALYDLNPELSCLSPILEGNYAGNLRELMLVMDRLAPSQFRNRMPMDRHIAGFIASKLQLMRTPALNELKDLPKLSQHPALAAVKLLEQAQEASGMHSLPGLTLWMCHHLLDAMDYLHSSGLRQQLLSNIERMAPAGRLLPITGLLNQRGYADADYGGYNEAVLSYFRMGEEIESYKNRSSLNARAAKAGTLIARQISSLALMAALAYYIWEYLL